MTWVVAVMVRLGGKLTKVWCRSFQKDCGSVVVEGRLKLDVKTDGWMDNEVVIKPMQGRLMLERIVFGEDDGGI